MRQRIESLSIAARLHDHGHYHQRVWQYLKGVLIQPDYRLRYVIPLYGSTRYDMHWANSCKRIASCKFICIFWSLPCQNAFSFTLSGTEEKGNAF